MTVIQTNVNDGKEIREKWGGGKATELNEVILHCIFNGNYTSIKEIYMLTSMSDVP